MGRSNAENDHTTDQYNLQRTSNLVDVEFKTSPVEVRELSAKIESAVLAAKVESLTSESGEAAFALALASSESGRINLDELFARSTDDGPTKENNDEARSTIHESSVVENAVANETGENDYKADLSDIEMTRFIRPYVFQAEDFIATAANEEPLARYQLLSEYSARVASQYEVAKGNGASEGELLQLQELFCYVYRSINGDRQSGFVVDVMRMAEKIHGVSGDYYSTALKTLENEGKSFRIDGDEMTYAVDGVEQKIVLNDLLENMKTNVSASNEDLGEPAASHEIANSRSEIHELIQSHWMDISRKLAKLGIRDEAEQLRIQEALVDSLFGNSTESVLVKTSTGQEIAKDTTQFELFGKKLQAEAQLAEVFGLGKSPTISFRLESAFHQAESNPKFRTSVDILDGTVTRDTIREGNYIIELSMGNIDMSIPSEVVSSWMKTGDIKNLVLFISGALAGTAASIEKGEASIAVPEAEDSVEKTQPAISSVARQEGSVRRLNGNGKRIEEDNSGDSLRRAA